MSHSFGKYKRDANRGLTAKRPETLAQTLARNPQIEPDLAKIIDAWPRLPDPTRRAMLVLAETGGRERQLESDRP
ncbi:MAG TPA: hypothetical protein VKU02_07120 [Gemmataceae bacterium]|nr:hypothetical protein [Gemmataceae bacterium]